MRATIAAITQIRQRSIAASSALIAAAALRCIAPAGLAACPLLADCRLSSQAKGSSFSRKSHEKARVTTANSRTPHSGVDRQYDLKIVEEPSLVFSRCIFKMG
jgi:hypothetical protein